MTNTLSIKKSLNCASALVQTLINLGVEKIFGYPGASVLSIYNELSKINEITHYLVRHEQAAVHMAEGYARVSGKTGVVLVTSGPGFTNTITGIANAFADSTPLVILAGDVAASNKDTKIFQNVDIVSMTKTCTKKTFLLSEKDNITQTIKEAFKIANEGVKGPVVVALPRNLLEQDYKIEEKKSVNIPAVQQDFSMELNNFYDLIKKSNKPLILLGGGAIDASENINKFVLKHKIPVVSTLMGIGAYPSKDLFCVGMIGINGTIPANTALNQCDLLISFGVSFSDRSTCKRNDFAPNAKIININIKSTIKNADLYINSDAEEFLEQALNYDINYLTSQDWINQIDALKSEFNSPQINSKCLQSSYVLETLSEFTQKFEPIVVTDVGQHQMLTAQFFNFKKPRKFITSGGLGTMGFGLPASIGAYLANPDSLVLNITGDGSFQMNLQELATCREHHIPIKIIIMNNGYLGMVRQLQEKIYNNLYQVEMINPDFTKIAEAYDLFTVRVCKKEELIPALEKAIKHQGTAIIDIAIEAFENI